MKYLKILSLSILLILTVTLCSCDFLFDSIDLPSKEETQSAAKSFEDKTKAELSSESETICEHLRLREVDVVPSTCTSSGVLHVICSDCGEVVMIGETEQIAHTEGEWIIDKEADYGFEGKRHTDCTVCGERIEETIPSIPYSEGVASDNYRYGKSTLSGNAVYIYGLLAASVMKEVPGEEIIFDESRQIMFSDFEKARMMFIGDYPECFWWGGTVNYYQTEEGTIPSLKLEYTYEGETLTKMRAQLDTAVDKIIADLPYGSAYDKALYLHDRVAEMVDYEIGEHDQTPYGALVEGKAVCNGYATAYQLLLMKAGIRAWTINGVSDGAAHAWNLVWMDEVTCVYTDVTWDDQDVISRYYFNMSLGEIDDDHTANPLFILPDCDHTREGYYDISPDAHILNEEDGGEVLAGFLGEESNGERKAVFLYTGSDFKAWFEKNNDAFFKKVGGGSVSYAILGGEVVFWFK